MEPAAEALAQRHQAVNKCLGLHRYSRPRRYNASLDLRLVRGRSRRLTAAPQAYSVYCRYSAGGNLLRLICTRVDHMRMDTVLHRTCQLSLRRMPTVGH